MTWFLLLRFLVLIAGLAFFGVLTIVCWNKLAQTKREYAEHRARRARRRVRQ